MMCYFFGQVFSRGETDEVLIFFSKCPGGETDVINFFKVFFKVFWRGN